jgi:hypothetical protein
MVAATRASRKSDGCSVILRHREMTISATGRKATITLQHNLCGLL